MNFEEYKQMARNMQRLDNLYETLHNYHKDVSDWRFMQLMNNFFHWYYNRYKTDGFFLEDEDFLKRFREFMIQIKGEDYYE